MSASKKASGASFEQKEASASAEELAKAGAWPVLLLLLAKVLCAMPLAWCKVAAPGLAAQQRRKHFKARASPWVPPGGAPARA